ncbi:MAG: cupin domain-containing protein [Acidimicrobiaceae bacterium]|nr:cupin domain-containing protein [Acidimicrobiaceae bacterium]
MPFINRSNMLEGSPLPGWSGTFFHSENMTFAYWDIAADAADLHEHHHPQEEVWNVVDGEVVLALNGQQRRLRPGEAAVVPPGTPHSTRVVGPCRAIVVDYPTRPRLPGVQISEDTIR